MTLTLIFFLSVSIIFFFFVANVILNPKRNPVFHDIFGENDPAGVKLLVGILNGIAAGVTVLLILSISIFQLIAGITLAAWMFHWICKHRRKTPEVSATEEERELSPFEQFDLDRAVEERRDEADHIYPGGFPGGRA